MHIKIYANLFQFIYINIRILQMNLVFKRFAVGS